jgi:hypothetical protein
VSLFFLSLGDHLGTTSLADPQGGAAWKEKALLSPSDKKGLTQTEESEVDDIK